MKHKSVYFCILMALLLLMDDNLASTLYYRTVAAQISYLDLESDSFREMKVEDAYLEAMSEFCGNGTALPSEFLTPAMALGSFRLPAEILRYDEEDYQNLKYLFLRYNRSGYETLLAAYEAVWDDVQAFPVPEPGVVFENSWMFERTYGGLRGHEGIDLMPPQNLPGHYRVRSMTDGVVERIGWLEKGGYRIGIRSPSGGYFYYAHLDSYAGAPAVGDEVSAGDILGYMGDTGYGPEGTRGRFDVHLHLGIYIRTDSSDELSVNPYWVLRYLSH